MQHSNDVSIQTEADAQFIFPLAGKAKSQKKL